MASLPFVGTLDSDVDVDQLDNESDSEEETEKPVKRGKTRKKGSSLFEDDFQFFSGELPEGGYQDPWNLDAAIKFGKQKQESNNNSSSLQDKIVKRRELKRKRKSDKENDQSQTEAEEKDEKYQTKDKEEKEVLGKENGIDDTGNSLQPLASDEEESSSEDDGIIDKISEKKKKFFEEPPPQVTHQTFTTMNLSRPLLKAINDLGFSHPTPIQASTVPVALMGKDICACAATGTGKIAAYMLPILERLIYRPQQALVTRVLTLTPTRELAIQVVKYGSHGHYHAHYDSSRKSDYPDGTKCCHYDLESAPMGKCRICRYITILYYLNDVEEGGETAFPVADMKDFNVTQFRDRKDGDRFNLNEYCQTANIVVPAKKGKAIMWYNYELDGQTGWMSQRDDRSLHGGCIVKKGMKYIANNWLPAPENDSAHLRSEYFQDPDEE